MVLPCPAFWCLRLCGAARVPCLARVWRALLAWACYGASAGTHTLFDGTAWLCGGRSCCPAAASVRGSGVCVGGGGGSGSIFPASPPPPVVGVGVPFRPALLALPPPWLVPAGLWLVLGLDGGVGHGAFILSCGAVWAGPFLAVGCSLLARVLWVLFVCGVHGPLALVHRCARSVRCGCGVLGLLAPVRRCARSGCRVCGVRGRLALVHRCARLVRCVRDVLGFLALVHRCACLTCCVCGVLGLLALVHRCARLLCRVCGVLGLLALVHQCACLVCCVCGVLGLLALVHQCACPVCCVCGVFGLLVRALRRACLVRCVCGVLGLLALVHRCACVVCCVACAVSLASWREFTCVCAWCVMCAVCLASWRVFNGVHAWCVVCAVSLASWRLFTGVHACCIVLCVWCPWPPGACSPVCTLGVGGCGRALGAWLSVWVLLVVVARAGVLGVGSGLVPGWFGRPWAGVSVGFLVWVVLEVAVWLLLCTGLSVCGPVCGGDRGEVREEH